MSNLLITSTSFAAIALSGGEGLTQHIGLIGLGLVLVVGLPLLITRVPSYEFAPGPSATATSAAFGMVHLP
jgi:hypothetical protein